MKVIKKISTKTVFGSVNARLLPGGWVDQRSLYQGDGNCHIGSGRRIQLWRMGMPERTFPCGQSDDW